MNQPLSEYLRNKEIRNSLPYRYLGWMGTGFYFMNGEALSHEDIERMLPIAAKVTLWDHDHKGDNPNRTYIE